MSLTIVSSIFKLREVHIDQDKKMCLTIDATISNRTDE